MKLSNACQRLYRRSTTRFPHMECYKYDYYREPVLKNKVSGKDEKAPRAVCVEEMMLMLNCLKTNDFDEKPCTKLIDTFNNCVQMAERQRRKNKELRKTGAFESSEDIDATSKRLPASQVTKLLQRFPEPK
ncbi:Coiled-coil-helix-coiled-coil-helix domain-containing protein 1 [Paragonimus heterotremus]|uniref:Coiled-coil-helix-coiled-coil-helix domain-containing protein 1 n=1 Tax=Paragonimus heterotremus TaxID=100268 RepID=A0A8J4SUV9_9TREM|nr:Coiled-coil-helix-coiled-coil-helix domain-containing protein 1 [Paragonimus heterotremus]